MQPKDTFEAEEKGQRAQPVLSALAKAEKEFEPWQSICDEIDTVYNLEGFAGRENSWNDSKLDLFWASFEVLKPAVYARPPVPAVSPLFKDGKPLLNKTAELLERASVSAFERTDMNSVMYSIRDDLLFAGRGVPWVRYDTDDGQKVCVDYLDRKDFRHEPCRVWSEVGWVARRAWLSESEVEKRFKKTSKGAWEDVKYTQRRDKRNEDNNRAVTPKAGIWEVWHRADNKVYWVAEGVDGLLDESEPELKLSGFFPCPKPAYATLKRRSLIPVPDWERYAVHFRKISELTGRIYTLLDMVRMKGLVPAGSEIGDAVELALRSNSDSLVIPVNGAGLTSGSGRLVEWLPLDQVAAAITGLIEARGQLISDFYELSGISDIMRGATEASETLGAQQLKTQYGSVRVQCKIDELQRVAADCVRIVAEVIAEKFTSQNIMDMAQLEIPTKKDIEKRIKEIEKAAEEEMKALAGQFEQQAQQAMQSGEVDPEQAQMAEQAFQEQQQAIYQKYSPMLAEAEQQIPIEDIMKLLRDDKARSFAFDVESDSTILTDELQEKQSRQEFMEAFMTSSQGLMQMASTGEQGATLAGELMKFVLAPYRVGRQLDDSINSFVDSAPELAATLSGEGDEAQSLVEAQNTLAQAEMAKAQAQTIKVQSDSQLKQAELQGKIQEMELKAQQDRQRYELEVSNMQLDMTKQQQDFAAKMAETEAKINKMQAETAEILNKIGLDVRKQNLEEYKTAEQTQQRAVDTAMQVENQQVERQFRERGEQRADMQQGFNEKEEL